MCSLRVTYYDVVARLESAKDITIHRVLRTYFFYGSRILKQLITVACAIQKLVQFHVSIVNPLYSKIKIKLRVIGVDLVISIVLQNSSFSMCSHKPVWVRRDKTQVCVQPSWKGRSEYNQKIAVKKWKILNAQKHVYQVDDSEAFRFRIITKFWLLAFRH